MGNTYSRITGVQPQEYEYAYSAWCTLFMTCMRTYSRALYSQNGLHTRICVFAPRIPHVGLIYKEHARTIAPFVVSVLLQGGHVSEAAMHRAPRVPYATLLVHIHDYLKLIKDG